MRTVEGEEVTGRDLSLLEPGEAATFAARPSYATPPGGEHWTLPLLLLTDRRMLISKDRLFGKRRADFAASWTTISTVSGQLWNGGGPKIQLIVRSTLGDVELIVQPQHASDVESAIRAGYIDL